MGTKKDDEEKAEDRKNDDDDDERSPSPTVGDIVMGTIPLRSIPQIVPPTKKIEEASPSEDAAEATSAGSETEPKPGLHQPCMDQATQGECQEASDIVKASSRSRDERSSSSRERALNDAPADGIAGLQNGLPRRETANDG